MFFKDPFLNKKGSITTKYGAPSEQFYCFLDYDERFQEINMKAQHFHPFYEIYIALGNKTTHVIDDCYYELSPYDIVCLPPGLLHKTFYQLEAPTKRLIIQFSCSYNISSFQQEYEEILTIFDNVQPIYRFETPIQSNLMSILSRMLSKNIERLNKIPLNTHNYIIEFLTLLYENRNCNIYYNAFEDNDISAKIYSICDYIHIHYAEALSLEYFAKKYYMSLSHLSRIFHKKTGYTLTEYIQRTRLTNAQNMLVATHEKISDIAPKCGFNSFSQFNRVFKKFTNMSPSLYRKSNEESFSL